VPGSDFTEAASSSALTLKQNSAIFVEIGVNRAPAALPVQYDMLIRCDGAQSKVQSELARHAALKVTSISEPGSLQRKGWEPCRQRKCIVNGELVPSFSAKA
jgi:hypothetical protein